MLGVPRDATLIPHPFDLCLLIGCCCRREDGDGRRGQVMSQPATKTALSLPISIVTEHELGRKAEEGKKRQ